MSWGLVAVAGGTLLGGALSSSGSQKAASTQADASAYAADIQKQMFDKSMEMQQPYYDAGYRGLQGLNRMLNPEWRSNALEGYYQSPEFAALSAQQEEQALRNASVTGARGGSSQAALAEIAPQLGMNYMSSLQNQYTDLANLGAGATAQGASNAMGYGANQANLAINAANVAAQNQQAQANMWGNTLGTLGGIGYNYFTGV